MIDLKPYGAFIEYSIRPLISELESLLKALDKRGYKKEEVSLLLKQTLKLHFINIVVDTLKCLGIAIIVCITALKMSQ